MNKRIRQVIAAVTARISEQDRRLIACYLDVGEAELFWRMNLADQRHALNVACTAGELADANPAIDRQLLIKCALLHDIGKVKGDVSTFDKIIAVLLDKFASDWARQWARQGRGGKLANLRHAIYIYYHHAGRGAAMLKARGASEQLAQLVARHHDAPENDDCPELTLLRQADSEH